MPERAAPGRAGDKGGRGAADILGTAAVGGAWDESEGATAQALGLGAGGLARTTAGALDGPGGPGGLCSGARPAPWCD